MKIAKPICLLGTAIFLSGCANNPATAAKKAGIHTVEVAPKVEVCSGMRCGTDLSDTGLIGLVTSAINDRVGWKGVLRMSAVMGKNHIDVAEMVREQAVEKLGKTEDLALIENGAGAVFLFTIEEYGFESPGGEFSGNIQ